MVSQRVKLKNPTGLHLRPAGLLCKTAIEYKSKILINFDGVSVNAKSVLGVLGACIKTNDEFDIVCEGEDEEDALAVLVGLVEDGIGENVD